MKTLKNIFFKSICSHCGSENFQEAVVTETMPGVIPFHETEVLVFQH